MPAIQGIVFDFGNTLAPFGKREFVCLQARLAEELSVHLDGVAAGRITEAMRRLEGELARRRQETLRESDPAGWIRDVVRAVGGRPGATIVAECLRCLHETFVELTRFGPTVAPVLEHLAGRFRLGLLSNYWMAAPIHEALERDGLAGFFRGILVSADLGLVKPHPRLFEEILGRLELPAHAALFVGDNLHADISGAAAVGMRTALTTEHLQAADERDRHPGDGRKPDHVLAALADLEALLER